ncbi:DUF421 domain-containing protein [Hymenobacter nivis]|uniref:DUF421 domain-containing protein n=1 Tax=Hymenobacter nivis TaxID=1850093 RepID=A0A502H0B3_9BACT|nr:YetF domain-containing protein [Hymenobacter nivis]TPG67524.1 DUF421 domain-containing protein [Hymenobacter nivis]
MLLAAPIEPFDWHRILWSADMPPAYLGEVAFRCFVTYLLTLGALRVTGRRGVRQLSIFELSIILALGSAAGDAMFYNDAPLLHVAVVFVVVPALYWCFNRFTEWSPRFSDWLEGAPLLLVEDGRVHMENFRQLRLTQKELFGELRQQQVEHLGQVRRAYMEATGNLSVYFYPPDEPVRPGLPTLPERLKQLQRRLGAPGPYACCRCGHVASFKEGDEPLCPTCQNDHWLPVSTAERVA